MSTPSTAALATVLILASALLHACANTLTKTSEDALITRGCMNAVAFVVSLPAAALVPAPTRELWPLLLASVLVHGLYPFFLAEAYRRADLSSAFPLARGSAPLFTAALGAVLLDQPPRTASIGGIVLLSFAVASLAFERDPRSGPGTLARTAAALVTGLTIAAYTLIDAFGLHLAQSAFTYIVWLFVLDGAFVPLAVVVARGKAVRVFVVRHGAKAFGAGVIGTLAYGMALLALSMGTVAEIAALRETSILFAALIGAVWLGEPFGRRRIAAAAAAVLAVGLMQLG